ncbi:Asp-tRNA(Asn)/Glu-tRNA(Gln) amidotransferase subunit GatC [Patescibacteria group bacterium]|nr:Asp-tRNA(Asn)/Glu-tRNA(Gln) amidotransferase subunit GatC [Patescibacteria group bacterium]MBU1868458.1 Asp-tRNA(Asn)/Glu-tRNA(Gln) amidotransferase subunit GatC [Patescibacteria group bacterium]
MSEYILTKAEVQRVAKLARITLSQEELAKFQKQLSAVIGYASQMNEVNTDSVLPTAQVTGLKNTYREDSPQKDQSLNHRQALANAPDQQDGYFKVKPVL